MTLLDQTSLCYRAEVKKDVFRLTGVHYTREDEALLERFLKQLLLYKRWQLFLTYIDSLTRVCHIQKSIKKVWIKYDLIQLLVKLLYMN